ncbi:hypothetical protein Pmani_006817 [Petrolisthes manimaculis]|uniref:Uncharacterized protein n=1 Tax=Petrolisthes manimaculis TaxID=1843537 RepID=A0AAE1QBX3_9EUCA|nr:hypothetical protein Pmani_006817 [Petrolisthes manimaculis]
MPLMLGLRLAFPRLGGKIRLTGSHWKFSLKLYLDYWLVFSPTQGLDAASIQKTMEVLKEMGMLVNIPKADITSTQKLACSGIKWSTQDTSRSLDPNNAL